MDACKVELEVASGFEPLSRGFAVPYRDTH
jgi:hypothetical protein